MSDKTRNMEKFKAVLFDLDGVITSTAKVHATCWKQMFDAYLKERSEKLKSAFQPFDIDKDYKVYVDGKPRYDGVRSFLESRGIHLPQGEASDPPDNETICGLGNRKNLLINEALDTQGVDIFQGSLDWIAHLQRLKKRIAVVSSSKNCQKILRVAGIEKLFEVRVDGEVAKGLKLKGKPAPDYFVEAANRLGVSAAESVVVEDAISGVQAGRAGAFGLVIGVDRAEDTDALLENGADIVVKDLKELLP